MIYQTILGFIDSKNITQEQLQKITPFMARRLNKAIICYKMLKERLPQDMFEQIMRTGKWIYSTSNNLHFSLWSDFENHLISYNEWAKIINKPQLKRSDFNESYFKN